MKRIHFLVKDFLYQQIEETMVRLRILSKSEFFRILALNCIKDNVSPNAIMSAPSNKSASITNLSTNEKELLFSLQGDPKTIGQLVGQTGLSVSEVSHLLIQLLLKKRVLEIGNCWSMI